MNLVLPFALALLLLIPAQIAHCETPLDAASHSSRAAVSPKRRRGSPRTPRRTHVTQALRTGTAAPSWRCATSTTPLSGSRRRPSSRLVALTPSSHWAETMAGQGSRPACCAPSGSPRTLAGPGRRSWRSTQPTSRRAPSADVPPLRAGPDGGQQRRGALGRNLVEPPAHPGLRFPPHSPKRCDGSAACDSDKGALRDVADSNRFASCEQWGDALRKWSFR